MSCQLIIPDSSMVEHAAVNRGVVGSSPTRGAGLRRAHSYMDVPFFVYGRIKMEINCFGDGLTEGRTGGCLMPYTRILEGFTGLKVNNYGIYGESSFTVGSRMGALPVTLLAPMELNEKAGIKTPVALGDIFKQHVEMLMNAQTDGDDLVNPVLIDGIEGKLSRKDNVLYFERKNDGDCVTIPAGTRVFTRLSGKNYSGDINIFWVGTNDHASTDNAIAVISNLHAMIDFTGSDRYIVIGLTAKSVLPQLEEVNEMLSGEFGEHFYNFSAYVIGMPVSGENNAFYEQDLKDVANGDIPTSLMKIPGTDHVHGNEKFYALLGAGIYGKLKSLNYI